ncbi:MAG TPA: response regulator transcription factor [Ktedonobacterales bacterium]|nr:response regulator transcription factor [Ktedonobacterales bacterium]
MRILLVEDEQGLATVLKRGLEEHGYAVDLAGDGDSALAFASTEPYDLVVLDVMLPDVDGFTVCRQLRNDARNMPVLMLTALDSVEDRVAGLDSGADDYLAKPFDPRELLARVRALLRRDQVQRYPVLRVADIELDTASHEVRRGALPIELTTREFAILELFIRNANRVLSRDEIAQHIWAFDFSAMSNVIDVYVGNLRRKLGDDAEPRLLRTVRGSGYLLRDQALK